jgi:hypothetical protein
VVVFDEKVFLDTVNVDARDFSKGIYMMILEVGEERHFGKLVKINKYIVLKIKLRYILFFLNLFLYVCPENTTPIIFYKQTNKNIMPTNFYIWFVAALIPMIIGAIYYHEKVFGSAWMKVNGFKKEDMEGANMAVILGVSYLFSVFIAFFLTNIVIHQSGIFQTMMPDVMESRSAVQKHFNELMGQWR